MIDDEELGAVSVFVSIGHEQPASAMVAEVEVFKAVAVAAAFTLVKAAATALAIDFCAVSSLDHEVVYDSVELIDCNIVGCRTTNTNEIF